MNVIQRTSLSKYAMLSVTYVIHVYIYMDATVAVLVVVVLVVVVVVVLVVVVVVVVVVVAYVPVLLTVSSPSQLSGTTPICVGSSVGSSSSGCGSSGSGSSSSIRTCVVDGVQSQPAEWHHTYRLGDVQFPVGRHQGRTVQPHVHTVVITRPSGRWKYHHYHGNTWVYR